MLLFGRATYQGMAVYWQTAQGEIAYFMNTLPKVVCSRTLGRADWANTRLVKDDVVATIEELKRQGNGNIFVFGSADLSAFLMKHGLFDEYRLGIAPTVMGRGKTLFGRDLGQLRMRLLEARPLSSGCVILRYEPLQAEVRDTGSPVA
jgi:dihydrofolate reductase